MFTKEEAQDTLMKVMVRLINANHELAQIEDGKTLYELHPSKSTRCLYAWLELNTALKEASIVLHKARIILGPDDELTAGPEITA